MLPDLHSDFSRGRSGGLVFPSLEEFSTVCSDPHKGFGVVNKTEIDVFLELSCFFDDTVVVGNLMCSSGSFWEAQKKQKINVNVSDLGSKWILMGIHLIKR